MVKKVVLLTEIISPYRIPVFNEISSHIDCSFLVLFYSETVKERKWLVDKKAIKFNYKVLPSFSFKMRKDYFPFIFNPGIFFQLMRNSPDIIIIGGYHHPSALLAMLYAKLFNSQVVLWCESNKYELRFSSIWREKYKRWFVRSCDGYIVPGGASFEYLISYGAEARKIWVAPNAVDNDYFAGVSEKHRVNREVFKQSKGYPKKIILYVGRLIDEKGVFDLLRAFQLLSYKQADLGLLLVGNGKEKRRYEDFCLKHNLKNVFFEGFIHQHELPFYYAVADVFVLPTHSDPWGLVLNEAMACKLPVISSNVAGAACNLIKHGVNGYIFRKGDIQQLAIYLEDILTDEQKRIRMAERSYDIIKGYSVFNCAQGFIRAIENLPEPVANSKKAVKDYWENEICGTRYGTSEEKNIWFREIEESRYSLEPYIDGFAEFQAYRGKRILEIGLGAGTDFVNWAKVEAEAFGIDISEASVKLTSQRTLLEGIDSKYVKLCVADAEDLPFKDNSFELVYAWGSLHHTPDTQKALREIYRVLKPSGVIKAMIYHIPSWTGFMLWLKFCLLRLKPRVSMREAIYRYLESPGTKAYTWREAKELFENAQFHEPVMKLGLGPGDRLLIRPSKKYRSFFYRIAWLIYPRWLVTLLGSRFGLNLMIKGKKRAYA